VKTSVSAKAVLAGDRRAIARALTEVENDSSLGSVLLDELFVNTGKAHLVGVTGSPGAGKSSLVNQIARIFRKPKSGQPVRVGIVAVDPSSPFTGGAILGDRVRMRDLSGDSGVFIRSMATRGTLGGLAKKTSAFAQILDAAGYELILIETVGAGQSEVDIARLAHTTIVVESPGMGDDIQAIKAGILEIADILVVNKADHPMADLTIRALKANLELAHPQQFSSFERMHLHTLAFDPVPIISSDVADIWYPPLFSTISTKAEGIEPLVEAIVTHKAYLQDNGQWRQREAARLQEELNDLLLGYFASQWRMQVDKSKIEEVVHDLLARKYSPQQSLKRLI
jgi:LAO/AO transport system kinase